MRRAPPCPALPPSLSPRAHGLCGLSSTEVRVVAGEPSMWKLHTTLRATCRDCGTRVFAEPAGFGMRGVMATLLPEGLFEAQFHMQCQHARLPVADALPHFKGFPAAFGGSNDVVDW